MIVDDDIIPHPAGRGPTPRNFNLDPNLKDKKGIWRYKPSPDPNPTW